MFPGSYVPRDLCSPGPMFLSLYETGEHRNPFFEKGVLTLTLKKGVLTLNPQKRGPNPNP